MCKCLGAALLALWEQNGREFHLRSSSPLTAVIIYGTKSGAKRPFGPCALCLCHFTKTHACRHSRTRSLYSISDVPSFLTINKGHFHCSTYCAPAYCFCKNEQHFSH